MKTIHKSEERGNRKGEELSLPLWEALKPGDGGVEGVWWKLAEVDRRHGPGLMQWSWKLEVTESSYVIGHDARRVRGWERSWRVSGKCV